MAYRKVSDAQGAPMEVLHCAKGLELDWEMDKEELPEAGPSMDCSQMQHVDFQRSASLVPVCSPGLDFSARLGLRCWSSHSPSLQPIDFVRAQSLKNGLFPVFPGLPEFLFALQSGQDMDPAHSSPPQSRLDQVEGRLQQFEAQLASNAAEARQTASALEQALRSVATQVQQLVVSVSQPAAPVPAPAPPPPVPAPPPGTAPEPRVGTPERYSGDPEGCNPFLTNCSILFALQPYTFASEAAKVAFTINHLTGRARLWGTAEWERGTPACSSFQAFSAELRKVFGPVSLGPDATGRLMSVKQGSRPIADYAIDFRTRARLSDWNPAAQCYAFLNGLAPYIKDVLVPFDLPPSLDGLINLTSRLDRRVQARRRELRQGEAEHRSSARLRGSPAASNLLTGPASGGAEPMQVGRTSLTPAERERRRQGNLCLYCGQAGHFVSHCPASSDEDEEEAETEASEEF
ncbi:Retrotransposon-derived protein PEG10 [Takifugu flavidus]|uniref:Retrotransposon-derived protein PEG10 n=1 Tax=Takifugu flavidus TaxID=433684 RepID=A0A5C6MQ11_9TELE|nr:Retrotransposon-derived protein PEG10 [Takifugu flavidus]